MTNIKSGLLHSEVIESRLHNGENVLTPAKRDPWYILLFDKFKDKLIITLCIAAVFSLILGCMKGEFIEPVGIIAAILLATTIGFWNEYSSSKKFDIINKVSDDTKVKVRRKGLISEIAKKDLVVGDIVLLEAGEEVPADVLVRECISLKVNESTLTGESKAVSKDNTGLEPGTYKSNMLLRGTLIEEGTCVGEVVAVGDSTEFGKTARKAAEITDVETPLNIQLNRLTDIINKCAIGGACILIFGLLVEYYIHGSYVDKDWMQVTNDLLSFIMISVALIVVAVPEGLPMAVTLALAYSMKKMANTNNLVRKMHACETLGATTLILTDKTGTLTENQMKVVGGRYCAKDYVELNILVNSTANIGLNGTVIGNPTEGALIRTTGSAVAIDDIREQNPILFRIPFNSKNKYMLTVINHEGKFLSMIKGAPEIVKGLCATYVFDDKEIIAEQSKGRRCIGFAFKVCDTLAEASKVSDFIFNGFAAIADPLRTDVPKAIAEAKRAGVAVKIVTGDNPTTAGEIAKLAMNNSYPRVELGENISALVDEGLQDTDVFARTKPEDKQILVTKFQRLGEVVAMTGDGTNDAPALNHAQVGIAMNNGTAVAKEAADIILLDNSFPSIVNGIKWGRSLYKNIQHFIVFQLTINVIACLVAIVGPFIGVDLPFTVIQMLWINLIMDTLAALALATEPANDAVMFDSPRNPRDFILTTKMCQEIFTKGIAIAVGLIIMLIRGQESLTEFFTYFVMIQWWNLFYVRVFGQKRSVFDGLFKNPAFIGVALLILVGQIIIVQFGGEMFRTEPLSITQWLEISFFSLIMVIVLSIISKILNRK